MTRDGRLILFHDETMDRTTDLTGPVAERTWDGDLRAAACAMWRDESPTSGFRCSKRCSATFPEARLNIDAKESRALAPLVELVVRTRSLDRVCLASFSEERIAKLRVALGPELCTVCGVKDVARVRFGKISRLLGRVG